eukprot:scaffold297142_cov14-Tisochrysis_lutea.AAC.1
MPQQNSAVQNKFYNTRAHKLAWTHTPLLLPPPPPSSSLPLLPPAASSSPPPPPPASSWLRPLQPPSGPAAS